MEDSSEEGLVLRLFEGVKEQHDEYQRIAFVHVYADEKRYARLDPRIEEHAAKMASVGRGPCIEEQGTPTLSGRTLAVLQNCLRESLADVQGGP